MRLFIGIAYYDGVKVPTMMCLIAALGQIQCEHTVVAHRGPYTHWNREQLMQQAYDVEATHLLFLDTDVTFPPDAINRLISHDKDIVGGNYPMRGTGASTVKMVDEAGELMGGRIPGELFRCHAVPTGFMLIDLEASRAIERPWFFFTHLPDGDIEGEDVWFCRRANEAGLEVWCDPQIPMEHIVEHRLANRPALTAARLASAPAEAVA